MKLGDAWSRRVRREMDRAIQGRTDLLSLFEHEIRADHICADLCSCVEDQPASEALAWMNDENFDVLGISAEAGGRSTVYGYVRRQELECADPDLPCKEYGRPFQASELIAENTSLADTLPFLQEDERVFIVGTSIHGIITRADLQKAPVRLLLFGLVTSLEQGMLELIRAEYPNDAWRQILGNARLARATRLLRQRRAVNEEIDLADCLQFCDKREIVLAEAKRWDTLGFESRQEAEAVFRQIEALRNRLAHSQDVAAGCDWPAVIELLGQMEELIAQMPICLGSSPRSA